MINSNRIKSRSTDQGFLLPTYPSDLIADGHPARLLKEIIDAFGFKLSLQQI